VHCKNKFDAEIIFNFYSAPLLDSLNIWLLSYIYLFSIEIYAEKNLAMGCRRGFLPRKGERGRGRFLLGGEKLFLLCSGEKGGGGAIFYNVEWPPPSVLDGHIFYIYEVERYEKSIELL